MRIAMSKNIPRRLSPLHTQYSSWSEFNSNDTEQIILEKIKLQEVIIRGDLERDLLEKKMLADRGLQKQGWLFGFCL